MAKTLLNGVNEVLKRVDALDADTGLLTGLTDPSKQNWIDLTIQLWNECIDDIYSLARHPKPNMQSEGTITLATGTRGYALPADLIEIQRRTHFYNAANNHYILILGDGGYESLILNDPEEDDTGLPSRAAIRPTDGYLYMERSPTADHNGREYKYRYLKDLELAAASDAMPFNDAAFRAMVAVVAQRWRREKNREFDRELYNEARGTAARFLGQVSPRDSWTPNRASFNQTDPMEPA